MHSISDLTNLVDIQAQLRIVHEEESRIDRELENLLNNNDEVEKKLDALEILRFVNFPKY